MSAISVLIIAVLLGTIIFAFPLVIQPRLERAECRAFDRRRTRRG